MTEKILVDLSKDRQILARQNADGTFTLTPRMGIYRVWSPVLAELSSEDIKALAKALDYLILDKPMDS